MTIAVKAFPVAGERSEQEKEAIKSIELPIFKLPYPTAMNPNREKATVETYRWIARHGMDAIYKSPEALQALKDADVPGLTMGAYVAADEKESVWVCELLTWMFGLDDHLDDACNFYSVVESASLFLELNLVLMWSFPNDPQLRKNLVEFLDQGDVAERDVALKYLDEKLAMARLSPGTVYDTSSPNFAPLCKAFQDLWVRLWESMSPEFMLRWGRVTQTYIIGNLQETRNRNCETIPPLDEYTAVRRATVAMYPCMLIVEYADKVNLPTAMYETPEMQHMLLIVCDVFSLHNDIFSLKKEMLLGDVHNWVLILSHERGCSCQEAVTIVFQMLLDRIADFDKATEELERVTPPEHKHAIARYIKCAQYWLSSSHAWHMGNTRYDV